MTAQYTWVDELQRRSVPARLQPMPREKAGEVLSLEWGGEEGAFDTRVERVFKVRCIPPCRGHVGYVTVTTWTPRESPEWIALSAAHAAETDAWIARQDERWREKNQLTGRERLEAALPGGGQRWVKFIPLEGWKIERGLWKLTSRAREQQARGYPVCGRRPGGPFKDMSKEQIANLSGAKSEIGSDFAADLRRSTMVPDWGQSGGPWLLWFPQYAQCPTRGCHRVLRIEPCWEALDSCRSAC
jgi:hypothetical protein